MPILYVLIFYVLLFFFAVLFVKFLKRIKTLQKGQHPMSSSANQASLPTSQNSEQTIAVDKHEADSLPIIGAYQKRWMFSYNEKDAYYKLLPIAQELGYTVFSKVRLLDLLEPVKGNPKYKTYFYKIQAKHVDFVLCDDKLVAKYIIELDDNSHKAPDRKKRDAFVDQVLHSVGYKIIHTNNITDDLREKIIP